MSNITGKINLMKLDGTAVVESKTGKDILCIDIEKAKLFKGEKGVYVDIFLWKNDEPDDYGNNFAIAKSKSKEQREAGEQTVYLGNAKYFSREGGTVDDSVQDHETAKDVNSDDLPF